MKKVKIILVGLIVVLLPSWHRRFPIQASPVQEQIIVGPEVQVSLVNRNDPHAELLVAASPSDPNLLFVCANYSPFGRSEPSSVAYVSTDGGRMWKPTLDARELLGGGDPACSYGPDGTAYLALSHIDRTPRILKFYKSKDGGLHWDKAVEIPYFDREYIAVDNSGGRRQGRIYINGVAYAGVTAGITGSVRDYALTHSDDGGESFSAPLQHVESGTSPIEGMGNSVVLSDGTLVGLYPEDYPQKKDAPGNRGAITPNDVTGRMRVVISTDGGTSFLPATDVDKNYHRNGGPKTQSPFATYMPYLAVDATNGPFKDRLYAVWPDRRTGHSRTWFSYSSDKGRTWSPSRMLDGDSPAGSPGINLDNLMPEVAVNRNGVIGVSWYDRRNDSDPMSWDVRFAASFDGGVSFLPSVQISQPAFPGAPHDTWFIASSVSGGGIRDSWRLKGAADTRPADRPLSFDLSLEHFSTSGGDTAGLTADAAGMFHAVWVDGHTGISQVWTTTVQVEKQVPSSASVRGRDPEDVSKDVALSFANATYDQQTDVLTVDAALKNTSQEDLYGPIMVRVESLKSELGDPDVTNANDGKVPGAVWDFSRALFDNTLHAGETSGTVVFAFHIANRKPFLQTSGFKRNFIQATVSVSGCR